MRRTKLTAELEGIVAGAGNQRTAGKNLAFVLCPSFHGATLLALLLNNHSQVSALGDVNPTRSKICGCGTRVSDCPFWEAVTDRLRNEPLFDLDTFMSNPPDRHLAGGYPRLIANAALNRAIERASAYIADSLLPRLSRGKREAASNYAEVWSAFYRLVLELHGTSLVIDGSKHLRKAALLSRKLEDWSPARVIHLVRDPRGFAASMQRNTPEASPRASAEIWADMHQRIEAIGKVAGPYLRVRYEDLALHPERELLAIFRFLRTSPEEVIAAPKYPLKHHLMGNDMLLDFNGEITLDERWQRELSRDDQVDVLHHAGSTAATYGYR